MSNFLFHDKFHRSNHHTVSSPGYPDSATDPIASFSSPFKDIFFNYLQWVVAQLEVNVVNIQTFASLPITSFSGASAVTISSIFKNITAAVTSDSYQWYSVHNNISNLSGGYNLYLTSYTTTNSLSNNWNLGYSSYLTLNQNNSANIFSTFSVVSALSSSWPFLANTLRLHTAQESTGTKIFAGADVTFIANSAFWDLSAAQSGFCFLTGNTVFKNVIPPAGKLKGGDYTLIIQQDGFGSHTIDFENDYVFGSNSLTDIRARGTVVYGLPVSYATGNITTAFGDIINSSSFTVLTGVWEKVVGGTTYVLAKSAFTTKWYGGGNNNSGQLGLGDNIARGQLVPIEGNWDEMVCGDGFTFALSSNTKLWYVAGNNAVGQFGTGDTTSSNTFIPITGTWDTVKCGTSHTVAKSANTNFWFGAGDNTFGQLGLGAFVSQSELLTQLPGTWDAIACGSNHTMAQSAGTNRWFGTGDNIDGQLGLNSGVNNRYIFTQVISGFWDTMVCGHNFTFAREANTKNWSRTGDNAYGQLATGDTISRITFVALTGSWDSVTCGANHTAMLSAGTKVLYVAGLNSVGQLGIGSTANQSNLVPVTGQWQSTFSHFNGNYTTSIGSSPVVDYIISGPISSEIVSLTATSITVIRFTCDGQKLFGKPTQYYFIRDPIVTYFAGTGITINPNPAELYINERFIPRGGIIVQGVVLPASLYENAGGLNISLGIPGR
ncbi:MAG: hypothetical protein EBU90_06080 [Proteobacteria bacterium]|nr:hypothetical protein [Pseudomonadota bacterium]NBP13972.1 hypothetical protein [bacterium]